MINNLANLFSKVMSTQKVQTKSLPVMTSTSNNPFSAPFLKTSSSATYGQNNPVKGGYFAGYYNGKQNIVGSRLFIEI